MFGNDIDRRDFDVRKSFHDWVYPAILAYFVLAGLWGLFIDRVSSLGAGEGFFVWFIGTIIVCVILVFGSGRRQNREMEESHHGYNTQDKETRPFFWFGTREYEKYRKDSGGLQGQRIGIGLGSYAHKLDELVNKQRNMECETCDERTGLNGGYFIETRRIRRLLGIPLGEKIIGINAYCHEHEPEGFV